MPRTNYFAEQNNQNISPYAFTAPLSSNQLNSIDLNAIANSQVPELGNGNPYSAFNSSQPIANYSDLPNNPLDGFIQANEGFRGNIYKDTEGFPTVGYGHKLTAADLKSGKYANGITREQANSLFQQDKARELGRLGKHIPNLNKLPQQAQQVLTDLSFNMGGDFIKKFPRFNEALSQGNYQAAANELIDSEYYRQVPNRANRNVDLLRSLQR